MNKRPEQNEYAKYYAGYISMIPEGDIEQLLKQQVKDTLHLLNDLSEAEGEFRYAPGKWSIKEVIGHVVDTERIMAYRLLSIARGDAAQLPGYDENAYVAQANFNQEKMEDLLQNLFVVREGTLLLLKSLKEKDWQRWGTANELGVTVRAIACIIAGHELHHRKILKERYLGAKEFSAG
ncbi:DinB family protein [Bacillus sp. CMF21]|uniref:DinB family protein n=1 Tax=Metabacillus dongyingensis TaxID=2874282 RepID=UPI001CC0B05F|nr:DinB family protein [Metabacillus dongyingensis]UAL53425.1 DinB family protein [Metabacillus dongyingensis]UOK58919.1 DinB family protein [Bacillus sp. OVS6]USK29748.1 DinB family protein [Bacillus sp. CMF21]